MQPILSEGRPGRTGSTTVDSAARSTRRGPWRVCRNRLGCNRPRPAILQEAAALPCTLLHERRAIHAYTPAPWTWRCHTTFAACTVSWPAAKQALLEATLAGVCTTPCRCTCLTGSLARNAGECAMHRHTCQLWLLGLPGISSIPPHS